MRAFVRASAVLALLLVPQMAVAAERLAVLPFSGTNVHPGFLQAAQELLRDHLIGSGRYLVMAVPGEPSAVEPSPAQVVEAGRKAGSDLVVSSHVVRLQSLARIRVTMYRTATGEAVFTDSMSTTGGPDQMDPVLKRLASSIATGQRAQENAQIDTVTESEADPYRKQMATRVFGLKVGMLAPLARPGRDAAVAPTLGIFWLYDARTYLAEVFVDFASSSNSVAAFNVGLGGYYPFERGNTTPYLGGGVAWSAIDFGGNGANGLRLHGAAGMLLGRLSSVQVRAEAGYFVNAFSEKASFVQTSGSLDSSVVSHGPMLNLGLGF